MRRFLVLSVLLVLSQLLLAQTKVNVSFQREPVQEVIQVLERDYDLVFTFTSDLIEGQFITARCEDLPLEEALTLLFSETDLGFELVSGQYVLLQAKAPVTVPTYRLCGRVVDGEGLGLAFVNLYVPATESGGTSEADGSFDLWVRGEPFDVVEISYLGFETEQRILQQLKDCPTIKLGLAPFSFQEIIVKEYITAGIEQTEDFDHLVLRPDRIDVVPGLTEADVLQMVQILPGVQSQDESASRINIRGGTPDQNLILWDGIPVYNGGHFFGMISSFNPYIVDEVDVFRSGFGPEYGGRVAGVIDIRSVNDIPERFSGNAGLNFTHGDIAIQTPLLNQKAGLVLSGRRAFSDIIESPTYRKISERVFQRGKIGEAEEDDSPNIESNLNFVFDDWNAKFFWEPTRRDQFAVSFFQIKDRLEFLASEQEEEEFYRNLDELNLNSEGVGISWARRWSTDFESTLRFASTSLNEDYQLQFQIVEEEEEEVNFQYFQQNVIEDRTLSLTNQWKAAEHMHFSFGYQYADLDVSRNWIYDVDDSDLNTDENAFHALFVDLTTQQDGPWRGHLGLRWNYSTALERDYIEPRLALQFIPSEEWQFRASAGRYHQFLSQVVALNDLGLNQELWVMADGEDLTPVAKSDHYSLGLFFQPSSFQFELEGYYKTISGLTSFSPVFLDVNGEQQVYEEGEGQAWGVDLLLRNRWNKYQTWLSYSYGRVFYEFPSFQGGDAFAAPHDRPHSIMSVHQWQLDRWTLSLSWNWRSGRAFTEAIDVGTNINDEGDEENFPIYDFDNTNANRLVPYHRLDASILYKFPLGTKGGAGQIGLSMLNLYNRENILSRQYFSYFEEEEDINDFVVEPVDRAMLRFTPNMVVRVSW